MAVFLGECAKCGLKEGSHLGAVQLCVDLTSGSFS